MILKFKKGSCLGHDLPSSYQAKLPNGNTLELFKSAPQFWISHEADPEGNPVRDQYGREVDPEEFFSKRVALICLKREYAKKFNG